MTDKNGWLFLAGVAALVVTILIGGAFNCWLIRRLRKYHAPTYESLGSPSLFAGNNPHRTNWLLTRFVFSSQSKLLGDPVLVTVCWIMRALQVVCLVLFLSIGWVLLFMSPRFAGGPH
jgi:hypothetical protein